MKKLLQLKIRKLKSTKVDVQTGTSILLCLICIHVLLAAYDWWVLNNIKLVSNFSMYQSYHFLKKLTVLYFTVMWITT